MKTTLLSACVFLSVYLVAVAAPCPEESQTPEKCKYVPIDLLDLDVPWFSGNRPTILKDTPTRARLPLASPFIPGGHSPIGATDDCGCRKCAVNKFTGVIGHTYVTVGSNGSSLAHQAANMQMFGSTYAGANGNNVVMSTRGFVNRDLDDDLLIFVLGPNLWICVHDDPPSYPLVHPVDGINVSADADFYYLSISTGVGSRVYKFWKFGNTQNQVGGQFYSYTDSRGTAQVTSVSGSNINTIQRTVGSTIDKLDYDYHAWPNGDKIEWVRARHYNGSSWEEVAQANFEYYGSGSDNGNQGDLKYVTEKKWDGNSWETAGVSYYRYHKTGFKGLKYVFGPEAYRRLLAVEPNPDSLDEDVPADLEILNEYADAYYEYDANGFPTLISGSNCGCGATDHKVTLTWSTNSGATDEFKHWFRKVVMETKDDSNNILKRETTYSSSAGLELLTITEDLTGLDRRQAVFYAYDSDGRMVLTADTEAIDLPLTGGEIDFATLEGHDDLLNESGGAYAYLKNGAGIIRVASFYSSTTATDDVTLGGVDGFLQYTAIKNGESGSEIKLNEYKYYAHTYDSETIYPLAEMTTYPDPSSTSSTIKARYTYEWVLDGMDETNQIARVTTEQAIAENSMSDVLETVEVFDEYGNRTWIKDANGLITYFAYDTALRRIEQVIVDPDTDLGGFSPPGGVPSGFANTSGSHRVTDYTYGEKGRLVKVMGPSHTVTLSGTPTSVRSVNWTVYIDNDETEFDEIWSASGYYNGSSYVVVGGVSVAKIDKAGRTVESIVTERDPMASGELDATEDNTVQTRWRRWSKSVYNDHGQMTESWVYHDIPSSGSGSLNTNYFKTTYEYDELERLSKVTDAEGRSQWTFYLAKTIDGAVGHETRVYPNVYNDGGYKLAGPVSVTWTDVNGRVVRSFLATATVAGAEPTGTETLTPLTRSTMLYDWRGHTTATRSYFHLGSLTELQDGVEGTNYYETEYLAHDNLGRALRTKSAIGDISAVVFDGVGRAVSSWMGTDDTGATRTDPGAGSGNLVMVSRSFYDADGDGTGAATPLLIRSEQLKPNLTSALTGASSEFTGVSFEYDLFGQRTWSKPDVGPWSKAVYNEVGQVIESYAYQNGSTSYILTKAVTVFEGGDRVAAMRNYKVNGSGGATSNYLETTFGYDATGRQNKAITGTGAFTLVEWDDAGRTIAQLVYADDDTVIEETVPTYNKVGDVIGQVSYSRNHDAGSYTGKLSADPTKSRENYSATWYDEAGRPTHQAFYGTNGNTVLTDYDPGTGGTQSYDDGPPEPNTSDDVIVSKTIYNAAGLVEQVVDNAGRVTKFVHDDAFRRTHVIENYKSGGTYWTSEPDAPKARAADEVRITQTDYNANGQVVRLVAIDPDADGNTSDNQVTQYIYSAELTDKGTPSGGIMSNSMLRAVIKPDSDDTVSSSALSDGTDTTYDRVEMTYYANGTPRTRKDHRGNVITYAHYDDGMMKAQTVTTLSGSTDGHVRALTYTYNDLRQPEKFTTHGNATDDPTNTTSIRNQVQRTYNGMHQLDTEYQQHGGAVVTSGGGTSPKVEYNYDDAKTGNVFSDMHRLEEIVYPNGREVFYGYSSGIWDKMSQVRYLRAEGSGTPITVEYDYLGTATIVETDYRDADVSLDYTETDYARWDRFGRPIEHLWNDYGPSPDVDAVRIKHGHDRAGNVMYREDVVAATSGGVDIDEFYGHDELHRLNDYALGALNGTYDGITGTAASEQDFTYDQLGNWSQFVEKATGSTTLNQTRTHNAANEIGVIGATTGVNWTDAAHDASGNMTTVPKPDDPANAYTVTYDAWNRTVKIVDASSSDTVAEYRYDALNRRERELVYVNGSLDHTRHFYFSASWQVIEERIDSETRADRQYVWGLRYVDDLILRDRDADGASGTGDLGVNNSGLEERLYALNDRQFNIVALAEPDGDIVKRFRYTPYGERIAMDPDFTAYTGAGYEWHHGFQGLAHDEVTGFIYNRYRYWLWHLGRFSTTDPTGYPDGLNAYAGYHVMWGGVDPLGVNTGWMLPVQEPGGLGDNYRDDLRSIGHKLATTSDPSCPELLKSLDLLLRQIDRIDRHWQELTSYLTLEDYQGLWGSEARQEAEKRANAIYYGALTLEEPLRRMTWEKCKCCFKSKDEFTHWHYQFFKYRRELMIYGIGARSQSIGPTHIAMQIGAQQMISRQQARIGAMPRVARAVGRPGIPRPRVVRPAACFIAGTIVLTENGPKPIEEVKDGERVWAMDTDSGDWSLQEVAATMVHVFDGALLSIRAGDDSINTTPNHPFWVVTNERTHAEWNGFHGRWTEASNIKLGDLLLTRSGTVIAVTRIEENRTRVAVYNLEVEGLATYAVGDHGILVHNKPASAGPGIWQSVNESMSARATMYQQQVTGRAGQAYVVRNVKFDSFADDVLIDCKGPGYSSFLRNGRFRPMFRVGDELLGQAQRQLRAANGTPIRWHVAEADAARAMGALFKENGIVGIKIVHTPAAP